MSAQLLSLRIRRWLASTGLVVVDTASGPDGHTTRDVVEIRSGMEPELELLVLAHEMAHVLLGHASLPSSRQYDPAGVARREVTAETAAAAAARLLGVDVGSRASDYLAQARLAHVAPDRSAGVTGRLIADTIRTAS